jgi:hypothetical protein
MEVRHMEYYGLFITDAWVLNLGVFAFIILYALLVVLVTKFWLKSWDAGSFLLALPVLVSAALAYKARHN